MKWMAKSMNVLNKPTGLGKVFVAGRYWEDGDETQTATLRLGYGVLYENGSDLLIVSGE